MNKIQAKTNNNHANTPQIKKRANTPEPPNIFAQADSTDELRSIQSLTREELAKLLRELDAVPVG